MQSGAQTMINRRLRVAYPRCEAASGVVGWLGGRNEKWLASNGCENAASKRALAKLAACGSVLLVAATAPDVP